MLSLAPICFLSFFIFVHCQIDIGTNVKTNFCPKYSYLSRIEFNKFPSNDSYDVEVECQKFQPLTGSILGQEECALRLPFPLQGYDLGWNDYLRNCRCNEYVAGIRHFEAAWDGKAVSTSGPRIKMIQLQCCWSSNKEQNPPSCVYSGMENLLSPWDSVSLGVRDSELPVGHNYAIQAFVIREGNINARICDYRVSNTKGYLWPSSGIHGCWSGIDWDCTENTDIGGICYDKSISLYSWNEAITYDKMSVIASIKTPNKQLVMCRSGYRITSLTKTVVNDDQGKSYKFSIRCTPMTSRSCYCLWLPKCPTDDFFGTANNWFVSGIRNSWDLEDKDSKVEILCCNSPSIKPGVCNTQVLTADNQYTFDLGDSLYPFPLKSQTTLKVLTNIETYYDDGVLNMRFNVCSAIYTYDFCYNDPCYWCRSRAYRDGVSVGGAGYWSAQDSGISSSSLSSSKSFSSSSLADSSYWNSWSGWTSWSGNWGSSGGGLSLALLWLGNAFGGSWSSWNSWHRNYVEYDDDLYSTCKTCYRSTTISRWSKWSRSSNGRTAWAASNGKSVSASKGSWVGSGHSETNKGGFAGSDSDWTSGGSKSRSWSSGSNSGSGKSWSDGSHSGSSKSWSGSSKSESGGSDRGKDKGRGKGSDEKKDDHKKNGDWASSKSSSGSDDGGKHHHTESADSHTGGDKHVAHEASGGSSAASHASASAGSSSHVESGGHGGAAKGK